MCKQKKVILKKKNNPHKPGGYVTVFFRSKNLEEGKNSAPKLNVNTTAKKKEGGQCQYYATY